MAAGTRYGTDAEGRKRPRRRRMLQRFLEKPSLSRPAGGDERRERRREGSETAAGDFPYGSQPAPAPLGVGRLGTAPRPLPCTPRLGRVGASRGKSLPPALGPGRRLQGRDGDSVWERRSGGLLRVTESFPRGSSFVHVKTLHAEGGAPFRAPGAGAGARGVPRFTWWCHTGEVNEASSSCGTSCPD